jgi:hypothetical protein
MSLLEPADFYREKHGWVYEALIDLYERHEPADLVTVGESTIIMTIPAPAPIIVTATAAVPAAPAAPAAPHAAMTFNANWSGHKCRGRSLAGGL